MMSELEKKEVKKIKEPQVKLLLLESIPEIETIPVDGCMNSTDMTTGMCT